MTKTELHITELGHRGDGIARTAAGPVYVPGALPGETVLADVQDGRAAEYRLTEESPDRITPQCRHFQLCGGCTVQHLDEGPYLAWKRDLVAKALTGRGIDHPVQPVIAETTGSRRRAVFSAARAGRAILFGYHEAASNRLVNIAECPVLEPAIVRALIDLKRVSAILLPKKGEMRVTVLATTAGLDVAIDKADRGYAKKIADVSMIAASADWARLSVNGEVLLEVRPPALDIGGTQVVPPPGGFVQATRRAEAALAELVLAGLGASKTVADLFSGSGTFALRIAKKAKVDAVEGDSAALKALDAAMRRTQGLKPVALIRRDLFRSPLIKEDLDRFDAVVFDPPRAGAHAQAVQLAASNVNIVVAVSCNPATLARDLRILIDGGYALQTVTPVDQFLFSPHIEVVAVLTKETGDGARRTG